jgi:bifunctional non-homologous end joining protein LigD
MLATLGAPALHGARFVYEPKYDGIRCLAALEGTGAGDVTLFSRNGNEKTEQFPEIVAGLVALAEAAGKPLVLDGEIVALDTEGDPVGFEDLQPRMHLSRARTIAHKAEVAPSAFILFDVLRDGEDDVRGLPLKERRARLEAIVSLLGTTQSRSRNHRGPVRLGRQVTGDGRALLAEAEARGWEGLVVKDAASVYSAGQRSPHWMKLKLTRRQEFVVGGFTEPGGLRAGFGALVIGVFDERGRLRHAGSVGSGFDEKTLNALFPRLLALQTQECPFSTIPQTIGKPHWVRPQIVIEAKYTEWTKAGVIRHPVFLGLRTDKDVSSVVRERVVPAAAAPATAPTLVEDPALTALGAVLNDLERRKQNGRIRLPDGHVLDVTNLAKIFWPGPSLTKGDLIRHYVRVSPFILPVVTDRPLVMRRFPDGITKEAFYQHRAPEKPVPGARIASLPDDDVPSRFVGGELFTLLYMAQLGSISQDPWFSTVATPELVEEMALDLDPMDGVPFRAVNDTALWLRDVLEAIGVRSFPKTSGASGVHIFIPMARGTSYEAGRLFTQIVATWVARQHPDVATVERNVNSRGKTVYIDCLQNIHGKTLACAYSARASEFAGVSTPLSWRELEAGIDPAAFTIETFAGRLRQVGDLWEGTRRPENRVNLSEALERLASLQGKARAPTRPR